MVKVAWLNLWPVYAYSPYLKLIMPILMSIVIIIWVYILLSVIIITTLQHHQVFVPMVPQWYPVSVIPVGSVLTTPMLDVRPTTVVAAMPSTMMRGATMSQTTAQRIQVHVYATADSHE